MRALVLAWIALAWMVLALAVAGCTETVRCPDGQIFDAMGACVDIPDSGPRPDAGADARP